MIIILNSLKKKGSINQTHKLDTKIYQHNLIQISVLWTIIFFVSLTCSSRQTLCSICGKRVKNCFVGECYTVRGD